MSEYIDRAKIEYSEQRIESWYGCQRENYYAKVAFKEDIDKLPVADVAPVRHGRWIKHGKPNERMQQYEVLFWSCSRCGQVERNMTPYCCSCGAKMDGGGICGG